MTEAEKPTCVSCAHWKRLSNYRGECRETWWHSTSYREVGTLAFQGGARVYEETKPDYWCTLFSVAPAEVSG
jgi:hypothetical protein